MEMFIIAMLGLGIGGACVFFFKKIQDESQKKSARLEAERIINRAKAEAAKIDKDTRNKSKDFETRARKNVETEIQKQKTQLKTKETQLERRLKEIEDQQKSKLEENERTLQSIKARESRIATSEQRIKENEEKSKQALQELTQKLESVAAMTSEQVKRELVDALQNDAKLAAEKKIQEIETKAAIEADEKAKQILSVAVSRLASEYTSERTVSVMPLPSEELKGKIIGREGRNIRTLEALCGVDLIVDDTPEAVVISGFDPVRRELAKRTLEKLMEDGRIHPARIEEVVEKQKTELNKTLRDEGERVCVELGITNMHAEIQRSLGSLKYRSTHTQNLLNHSMEVAHLAGLMAAEMGANIKTARRAGLLHDIGKAVDHTVDGNHAIVGADFAKKYGEQEAIVHAIRAHHNDEAPDTVIAQLVQAANLMSKARPGARRPGMENFVNRLTELESIGNSFDGVQRTFAVQAGKEVRVVVEASKVTEDLSSMLSRDIARKIEREMPHLGSVRVAVVRETRSVEMAR